MLNLPEIGFLQFNLKGNPSFLYLCGKLHPVIRYFIELSYFGKNFYGWQVQPDHPTVQKEIQDKLSILSGNEVRLTGAGRTDTGVNASYFVAHFDGPSIDEPEKFLYNLNNLLPPDIIIHSLVKVAGNAHSRFDALKRTYKYLVLTTNSAFVHDLAFIYKGDLDLGVMQEAAAVLREYNDFTSFAKLHSNNTNNLCSIYESGWTQTGPYLVFTITANRFLRNMVRSLTGTLLEIGRGKRNVSELGMILESRDNRKAGQSAPARGLYLCDIEYPQEYRLNNPYKNSLLPFIPPL